MDPVTLSWITFGTSVGSYLLHAWQAYRSSRPQTPQPSVQPTAPIPQPATPSMQPGGSPAHISIGHGELLGALGGFVQSLLGSLPQGGAQPAAQPSAPQPASGQPAAQPGASQPPPVDLNALFTGLLNVIQQSQPKQPQPASSPIAVAPPTPSPVAAGS
jgi:hypothetical protein